MTTFADGVRMPHFADQHQCCWIMGGEQCGLWCSHDGDHLPYTPGDYLPESILHPLTLWLLQSHWAGGMKRCPICGHTDRSWGLGIDVAYGLISRQVSDEVHLADEGIWRFQPCGCEGREILRR